MATAEQFAMGQDVCLIRSGKQNSKYMLYLLRSQPIAEQLESAMVGATFRRVNVGQIKMFWMCCPPSNEQHAIAEFLDHELSRIDRMIEKIKAAVERLQESRAALITAAVTGKVDMRNHERHEAHEQRRA